MKKDCMFQYATRQKIIEDTDLITFEEAKTLWEKYQDDIQSRWNDDEQPQMVVWVDCENNTNYSKAKGEIDYRDCELQNGRFYKVTKTLIRLEDKNL